MRYQTYITKSFTDGKLRLLALSAAILFTSAPVLAENMTAAFDAKHKTCLETIAKDADLAYEEAMIWRGDGGGRRARHCEAMALFALDHKTEAAHRLDELAGSAQGGNNTMRVNYYNEASNFWLLAKEPKQAYLSATRGLELDASHAELRIARARAYAQLGRYQDAETDLSSVLAFHPADSDALRYRADARRHLGKLGEARSDIEKSLRADPSSVETALLRGKIIQAQNKPAAAP